MPRPSVQPSARGPVTSLPLPRFVSLRADTANVRRGPSLDQRIDWEFVHRGLPLQIIAEYGQWRRVRDADGATGWVHHTLLSGVRTALVQADAPVPLRATPNEDALVRAMAEPGAIARLEECADAWCEIAGSGVGGGCRAPRSGAWDRTRRSGRQRAGNGRGEDACRTVPLRRGPLRGGGRLRLCAELPLFAMPARDRRRVQAAGGDPARPATPRRRGGPVADPRGRDAGDIHCAGCGSLLYSVVREGAWVHVAMGTLVDAPAIRPSRHIFVGSKAPWFEITDDLPQFEAFG